MMVGKNFLPEDDKSQFNVLVQDAGRHLAAGDRGIYGTNLATDPRASGCWPTR